MNCKIISRAMPVMYADYNATNECPRITPYYSSCVVVGYCECSAIITSGIHELNSDCQIAK